MKPQNIYELFVLDDEAFVKEVYHALLGREPDANGIAYYCGRMAAGYSKSYIVYQISLSNEFKAKNNAIEGLAQLILEEKRAQHWLWSLFNRNYKVKHDPWTERTRDMTHINGLINQLEEKLLRVIDLIPCDYEKKIDAYKKNNQKEDLNEDISSGWIEIVNNPQFIKNKNSNVVVEIENKSKVSWLTTQELPIFVSYKWYSSTEDDMVAEGERTPIHSAINENEVKRNIIKVRAPSEFGVYYLEIDIVFEHNYWFKDKGFKTKKYKYLISEEAIDNLKTLQQDYAPDFNAVIIKDKKNTQEIMESIKNLFEEKY